MSLALFLDVVSVNRKFSRTHHRENHPAWANHEFPSFGENCRQQLGMIANVLNAFPDGSEVDEIPGPERFCGVGVWL